jgi:hypothetical protein
MRGEGITTIISQNKNSQQFFIKEIKKSFKSPRPTKWGEGRVRGIKS